MSSLDSFTAEPRQGVPYPVSNIRPVYSHDRTIITVVVLCCGTALLWHFGESVPVVALVSSMWTLALTFWFRVDPYQRPDGGG